jgi:hypothetical protein
MVNRMTELRLGIDDEEARRAIASAADGLLRRTPRAPRMRVVLTGPVLSAPVMAALIAALRRLREFGGAIVVEAEDERAKAALATSGLDRVFALPIGETDPEPGPEPETFAAQPGRSHVKSFLRSSVALLAVMFAFTTPAARADVTPAPVTDPAAIIAHVVDRNPDLGTYQSRVHIDVRMTSFPWLHEHLDGSTYFKRPNNYEVAFDRVPGYAKGFEKLYTDIGDPANWGKRFQITVVGMRPFEGHQDIELRMVQRVRGMIDHETVLVDPAAWAIDELEYHYYTGGVIAMTQHFQSIDGHSMLAAQDASIDIPHVRAIAHGTYGEYRVNVAIDDAVFAGK